MKSTKPDWYLEVKGSFKGNFTSEMKENVIHHVRHKKKSMKQLTFLKVSFSTMIGICAIVTLILLWGGIANSFQSYKSAASGQPQNNELKPTVNSTEKNKLTFTKEPVIIPNTNIELWEEYESRFSRLSTSSVDLQEVIDLNGRDSYLIYTKSDEKGKAVFQGLQLAGVSKPGELLELGYGSMDNVEWRESQAFGENLYTLSGQCGPNLICTFLLTVEDENINFRYMLNSEGYEVDLDGDGIAELIATTDSGFDNKVYIIKKRNNEIVWADVNSALDAESGDSVTYEPQRQTFKLSTHDGVRYYRIGKGMNQLVQVKK
ncbi:MAG: hypothetical protein ACQEXX_25910 [Bacillota bacterium]